MSCYFICICKAATHQGLTCTVQALSPVYVLCPDFRPAQTKTQDDNVRWTGATMGSWCSNSYAATARE